MRALQPLTQEPVSVKSVLRVEAELRLGLRAAIGAANLHRTLQILDRTGLDTPHLLKLAAQWPQARPTLLARIDDCLDSPFETPPTPWWCVLHHISLHLAADCAGPDSLQERAHRAATQGAHALAQWRKMSDARFSQVHCIDWAPGETYCRKMGYVFEGREYAIQYLGERRLHQQRAWEALCAGPVHPLMLSTRAWRRSIDRLCPNYGNSTPASRTA